MITKAEVLNFVNKVIDEWNALFRKQEGSLLQYYLVSQTQKELSEADKNPTPQRMFQDIFNSIEKVRHAVWENSDGTSDLEQIKLEAESIQSQISIYKERMDGISKIYLKIIGNTGVLSGSEGASEILSNTAESEQQGEHNQDDSVQSTMDSSKTMVNEWIDKNQKWLLGELPYASSKQNNPTTLLMGAQVSEHCGTGTSQNSLARPTE